MHLFLACLFEGVVLGIAIVLLITSRELRDADRSGSAATPGNFDEEQVRCPNMRETQCAKSLSAQRPSNRANDSGIVRPPDCLTAQSSPIGLTLS